MEKVNNVQRLIRLTEDTILTLLLNNDLLDDAQREAVFKEIDALLDANEVEIQEMLRQDIEDSYKQGLLEAIQTVNNAYNINAGYNFNLIHREALVTLLNDSFRDLRSAYRTAKATSNKAITSAINNVRTKISQGVLLGQHTKTISLTVANEFYNHGLKAFYTVDGKVLPLEFYASTVSRTKVAQARTQAHRNHYLDVDNDLYKIQGSYDACGECAKLHDVVFSITGNDPRFKKLDPNDILPIHPNCRCTIIPYVDIYEDDEAVEEESKKSLNHNPDVDPRTQAQREMYERSQEINRRNRAEQKQYDEAKALLGNEVPKTLGAFRRMKRNNTKGYKKLQSNLRQARKTIKE